METAEVLESLQLEVGRTADVHRVFGDPVRVGEKTVIPVAYVDYGFGGGMGHRPGSTAGGGGGGGRVHARPVGIVEVSDGPTKFVPIYDPGAMMSAIKAGLVGLFLGIILARR